MDNICQLDLEFNCLGAVSFGNRIKEIRKLCNRENESELKFIAEYVGLPVDEKKYNFEGYISYIEKSTSQEDSYQISVTSTDSCDVLFWVDLVKALGYNLDIIYVAEEWHKERYYTNSPYFANKYEVFAEYDGSNYIERDCVDRDGLREFMRRLLIRFSKEPLFNSAVFMEREIKRLCEKDPKLHVDMHRYDYVPIEQLEKMRG